MDWDKIILFILGLLTARDLISKNFDIPNDRKWSWLFYDKKDCEKIPYCYQLNKINKGKPPIAYNSELLPKLLIILGNHTKFFEGGVFCDRDKRMRINHLVSTLEASHNSDDLKVMLDIVEKLYFGISTKTNIDFVISLKGGNVLLVNKLVEKYNNELIHLTYNRNLFFESFGIVTSNSNDAATGRGLKFENMDELVRIASLSKRKLNGFVLDCSYSSGEGIIQCVKEFNEMLKEYENSILNINPIKEVRAIYSHVGKDINDRLEEFNCNIEYLFSLNDENRKYLYEFINQENREDIKLQKANELLKKLKSEHLLNDSLIQ